MPGTIHFAGVPKAGSRVSKPSSGAGIRLRTDGQHAVLIHLPAGDFDAAQVNHVFARLQLHVVGDVNGRHQEAELQGEVAPKRADALQQLPALRLIDQRHQRVADFQAQVRRA